MYPADFNPPSLYRCLDDDLLTLPEHSRTPHYSPQDSASFDANLESIIGSMGSLSVTPTVQPMHKRGLKVDACTYSVEGTDYPRGTETVRWFNGLITAVPFAAAHAGVSAELVSGLDL